jgi:tripartite-type tricarboxylate transporter receptor subunit TctC
MIDQPDGRTNPLRTPVRNDVPEGPAMPTLGGQVPERRRNLAGLLAALGGCALSPAGAFAQGAGNASGWPAKAVRLVVPFPPGGGTDAFARPWSKVAGALLGQPVVVDNRGGAGGNLGAEIVAKSPSDGYTFLLGATHHAIAPSIYPKLGYDLLKELTPITVLSYVPNVVVINPARLPVRSFAQFHKLVLEKPGKLTFGSAGNGTAHHLVVELYKLLGHCQATHIPYRGSGPALQDLLAGQIDFMFDGLGSAMPHIKSGKLMALAVTSAKRSFALPDVPTLAEAGIKGYEAQLWYALWGVAGTAPEIVGKLQRETAKALAGGELKEIWAGLGAEPGGQSPSEMANFVNAEIRKWAGVVKDSGAKLD